MKHTRFLGWNPIVYFLFAMILMNHLWQLNGLPLFYFDSWEYFSRGDNLTNAIQRYLFQTREEVAEISSNFVAPIEPADRPKQFVTSNRFTAYSFFLALLRPIFGFGGVVVLQSLALMAAIYIPMRAAFRAEVIAISPLSTASIGLIWACLGSAGFYTTYLMPDIFTPIMILLLAGLCAFGKEMTKSEIIMSLVLVLFSVGSHASNILILALLTPLVAFVALRRLDSKRAALVIVATVLALGIGVLERILFKETIENVSNAEAHYHPFLTVRLIADGPGFDYLAKVCPDDTVATCALYKQVKSLPKPLQPDSLMFSSDPDAGAMQFLDKQARNAISKDQLQFVKNVLMNEPLGVFRGALYNFVDQLRRTSVVMTLPLDISMKVSTRLFGEDAVQPRLRIILDNYRWLRALEYSHNAVYLISLVLIGRVLIFHRNLVSVEMQFFSLFILAGILINAAVCGVIVQPAERYGGRVIFLLPMMAYILTASARPNLLTAQATLRNLQKSNPS